MPAGDDYSCRICLRDLCTQRKLTRHNREVHGSLSERGVSRRALTLAATIDGVTPETPATSTAPPPDAYTCGKCGQKYGRLSSLVRHRAVSHDAFGRNVCDICGDGFSTSRGLLCHTEQVHPQDGGAVTRTQSGIQLVPRVPILAKTTRKRAADTSVGSQAKRAAPSTFIPPRLTDDQRSAETRVPDQRRLEQLFPPGQPPEQQTLPLEQTPNVQQAVPEQPSISHAPPTDHTPPHTPPPLSPPPNLPPTPPPPGSPEQIPIPLDQRHDVERVAPVDEGEDASRPSGRNGGRGTRQAGRHVLGFHADEDAPRCRYGNAER